MARRVVKTLAQKMAVSGLEPAKDVLDDSDLADDPIISAIQSLRAVVDDLNHNDNDMGMDALKTAITANTAKVGTTSTERSRIVANHAKVGTTSTERTRIAANHAKVSYDKDLGNTEGKTVKMTVNESRGTYSLTFTMTHGEVTKTVTLGLR